MRRAASAGARAGLLETAGRLLSGERWQRPLGRLLGFSSAMMTQVAAGNRPVTEAASSQLGVAIGEQSGRLRPAADELARMPFYIDGLVGARALDAGEQGDPPTAA